MASLITSQGSGQELSPMNSLIKFYAQSSSREWTIFSEVNRIFFRLKASPDFSGKCLIPDHRYCLPAFNINEFGLSYKSWEPWCVFCCMIIDDHKDDFFKFSSIRNQSFRRKNGSKGEKMKKMSDFSIQDKTSKGLSGKHFEDLIAEMRRQISRMDKRIDDLEKTKNQSLLSLM